MHASSTAAETTAAAAAAAAAEGTDKAAGFSDAVKRAKNDNNNPYRNFSGSLGHIYRNEGLAGLWRGSVARVVFTAPNTAITMLVYEQVKGLLAK